MRIKVYGGTPSQSSQSLCETCRHSTIARGRRLEEELVLCEARPMGTIPIRFVVAECSAYLDAQLPSYSQLLEQAWILKPRDGKRAAGFVRSTDLPPDERYQLMKDMHNFEE
jgi:hypothetical protein